MMKMMNLKEEDLEEVYKLTIIINFRPKIYGKC